MVSSRPDHDSRLPESAEDHPVQGLVTWPRVEALDDAVAAIRRVTPSATNSRPLSERIQAAVCPQMRRLEEMNGVKLGRNLRLTGQGEIRAVYARRILCLNDEVIARFRRQTAIGVLRVGLPIDYAVAMLQGMMTEHAVWHPGVELEFQARTAR